MMIFSSLIPTINFIHAQEITSLSRVGILAFGSFALSMALTPIYTKLAFKYKFWKQQRTEAVTGEKAPIYAKLHAAKHKGNIPTMGGAVTIVAIAIITLLFNFSRNQTWLPLFTLVAAGVVGLFDDYLNIRASGTKLGVAGMRAKIKFSLILGVAVIGALWFYYKLGYNLIHIPAVGDFSIGWLYMPLFVALVISTANAVNITDGLDGLSGGLLSTAYGAYAVISYFQGNYGIAGFCATVVGALLTFTWFNIYPARFFMGDSGAFGLGTALGVIVMLTNTVVVFPIIAAVFVVEGASSAIQILSKKIRHKKIFLSAPLHHHLEAIGWPETKVTMRFWVIGQVMGALGLALALLGNKLT
ncbi:MAG TPA: phospho-N-acetylmuramoyl-pentapeptide-transferase, partial [Candidatus Saccharimonadia bacterium]|nr:phospho-N-acetylmuramoyl-pentapeptide-transferase [Candidatus Saccharimonadia bacterium]